MCVCVCVCVWGGGGGGGEGRASVAKVQEFEEIVSASGYQHFIGDSTEQSQ